MKSINKRVSIIVVVYVVVLSFIGGTLAYLNWETADTQQVVVSGGLSEYFECSITSNNGSGVTSADVRLAPASCTNEKYAIKRELNSVVNVYGDLNVNLDLWLKINSMDEELRQSSNFRYAITTNENSCSSEVIASGSFQGKENGSTVELFQRKISTTEIDKKYYLYIWLDAEETSIETANKNFDFSLEGSCTNDPVDWENITHTITYKLGNGSSTVGASSIGTTTCSYTESCTLTNWNTLGNTFPNSANGWSFEGWSSSSNGTSVEYNDDETFLYEHGIDMNLYAIGSRTLKFYAGIEPTSVLSTDEQYWNPYGQSKTYMSSVDVPTAPTITGWTFVGWRDDNTASGDTDIGNVSKYTGSPTDFTSLDLRGIYGRPVTVIYNANGGSGETKSTIGTQYYNSGYATSSGTNSGANIGSASIVLANSKFTKTNYGFVGWNTKADGSGTSYAAGDALIFNGDFSDSTTVTLYAQWSSGSYYVNFDANGGNFGITTITTVGETTYTVPIDGAYKLEVWGAQGGNGTDTYIGGYGGYSVGTITLNAGTNLYVNVGGQGITGQSANGGYNGGGKSGNQESTGGSGGGATHIATQSGILSSLSSKKDLIFIVAGGGGGGGYYSDGNSGYGGHGGGYIGTNGTSTKDTTRVGGGGTQTSGGIVEIRGDVSPYSGSFGQGGTMASGETQISGGGGGGYYGGSFGGDYGAGGGGGSGYIENSLLTNKAMYCYNCSTSSTASTLTYSTTNVSSIPIANYAKSGSGAARITFQETSIAVTNGTMYGNLPTPTRDGYSFVGWNTKTDGTGQTITSSTVANLSDNQTLYALWQKTTFTVTFNANGGSTSVTTITVTNGATYGTLPTPTRSNYVFVGWNTNADGTGTTVTSSTIVDLTSDQTLYAQYGKEYTVSFNANIGFNDTTTFTTVGENTYTAPWDTTYKLEVWGAQGGSTSSYRGGYGGYSKGEIILTAGEEIFVNVGGQGQLSGGTGGYNGGGTGSNVSYLHGPGGGGATHIATTSGLLSSLSSKKSSILIVAGGGGGAFYNTGAAGYYGVGGNGGGYKGTNGTYANSDSGAYGTGGTQTSAGYGYGTSEGYGGFGYGGNVSTHMQGGAGGGGYYGGGGSAGGWGTSGNSAGGGGSGYIGNALLTNKLMYCYSCATSSAAATLTYSTTNVSSTPTANYAKSGTGAARITYVSPTATVVSGLIYGTLPTPTRYGYRFIGWNTKDDGSGETITSSTVVNLTSDQTLYAQWMVSDTQSPTISSVSVIKDNGTINVTVTASDDIGVSTYYYYLSTDGTCPTRNELSNYKETVNSSYSFAVPSEGTYYVCAFAADRFNNIQSSASVSNGLEFKEASYVLESGSMEMQTRQGSAGGSFSQYLGSAIYGNGTWNVQMGFAGSTSKYYNLQLKIKFPKTATNVNISFCTGADNYSWVTMRYKTLREANSNYWNNYPGSSYYGDDSSPTFSLSSDNYVRSSFDLALPSGNTVFEKDHDYYVYAWRHSGNLGTWYWTAGGDNKTTVTYTALS